MTEYKFARETCAPCLYFYHMKVVVCLSYFIILSGENNEYCREFEKRFGSRQCGR